jgi:alkylated DNA repair protein (DNA oxidative demethylase)
MPSPTPHTDAATPDLFETAPGERTPLGEQACVLHGWALARVAALMPAVAAVAARAPFRHMATPAGTMSVALTNCGAWGWTADRRGYRYTPHDPDTGLPWPPMPEAFSRLAREAAAEAGFPDFEPDACLINRYAPGSRMGLHQDRDEHDLRAPIVSVSLGMPATFLWGALRRSGPTHKIALHHGDVVVWGGVDRMRYHGIAPLKDQPHAELGSQRINFTFRHAAGAPP